MTATATPVLPDQKSAATAKELDHSIGLFRHVKRPEWGVAILAWETGKRRAYQFDDGKLRRIRRGYYSFMQPVENLHGSEKSVVADLREAISLNKGARRKVLEPVATFAQQLEIFEALHPNGFKGEDWIEAHRRSSSGRQLKRHRDPVAQFVQERLAKSCCDQLLADGRHDEIVSVTLDAFGQTSLVPVKSVRALKRLDADERVDFAEAIRNLLHGPDEFGRRFALYVRFIRRVLGVRPSWQLATALPALMYPQEHVCVRRTAFIRQAADVAPAALYTRKPRRRSYENYRAVALTVRERLEAAGHEPRDLLDVRDFVWATLRNAALANLPDRS